MKSSLKTANIKQQQAAGLVRSQHNKSVHYRATPKRGTIRRKLKLVAVESTFY